MKELKVDKMKKRTFSKVQWAVKAYRDWRSQRMMDVNSFDVRIYECDIDRVELLERDSFEFSMCTFLAEVRKLDAQSTQGRPCII